MTDVEFKEFMHEQIETMKLYIQKSKKDANECCLEWIEKFAENFRKEWLKKHEQIKTNI